MSRKGGATGGTGRFSHAAMGPNYDPVRLLPGGSPQRSAGRGTISALVCTTVGGSRVGPRRSLERGSTMPRGDKSKYTDKQKRQAEKIEEGYEERGVGEKEAERRAWATVNAMSGGGKKPGGSGRGKKTDTSPAVKGGRRGGAAAAARPAPERSKSAKKAAATRKRRATAGTKKKAVKKK